jgi:peptide chain release factor 2
LPGKQKRKKDLEERTVATDFWQDPQKASKINQEIQFLQTEITEYSHIQDELSETEEFLKISSDQSEEIGELEKKVSAAEKKLQALEFKTFLGGKYDSQDAILSIHSGAGGVDAQDWAEMLMRMYLRWAERNKLKVKILEEARGQEAGLKNVTFEISGPYVYGKLKNEAGVHRLVRLSPFNANNLRQTSFALVEVMPVIEEIQEVIINPQDLRIDVYRSSGAGGQGVNTTDSAVRIMHVPTGLMATCQNERSQLQNKEEALKILKAKLHKKYLAEMEKEKSALRGEPVSAEWGSQIRSYVLHPYKLVKDHRTKFETTDTEGVLAGQLEALIENNLRNIAK